MYQLRKGAPQAEPYSFAHGEARGVESENSCAVARTHAHAKTGPHSRRYGASVLLRRQRVAIPWCRRRRPWSTLDMVFASCDCCAFHLKGVFNAVLSGCLSKCFCTGACLTHACHIVHVLFLGWSVAKGCQVLARILAKILGS